MQPDTAADGDSSINTKKGFLISLPSRKKKNTDEPGSGIVMAKNDAAKRRPNSAFPRHKLPWAGRIKAVQKQAGWTKFSFS